MNGLTIRLDDGVDRNRPLVPATIIVPIDGAEMAPRALDIARQWARRFDAELVVITVAGEHEVADLPGFGDDTGEPRTVWRSVHSRSGLAGAVVDMASQETASAVCVGTRAHSPLVDALRDDIAQEVLRSVEVPVLLIGPHCRTELLDGPVVVAHDGLPGGNSVIHAARVWATALDVPSIVLHIRQPLSEERSDVMPVLRAAEAQLGGAPLELVKSSFPAGGIRDYVHEVDASLLALSTRGSTGTLTASTGRTATWLVRESPCPVLVAHPSAVHAG